MWRWEPALAMAVGLLLAPGCIPLPDKAFSCEQDEDCAQVGGAGAAYVCRGNVCVPSGPDEEPDGGDTDAGLDGGVDAGLDGGPDAGTDGGVAACTQVSAPMPCSEAGWCWDNPLSGGSNLFAIRGRTETDIWAVGGRGVALHWDGRCWARGATARSEQLRGIWPASGQTWWAVGEGGLVLQWNGSSWTATNVGQASLRDIEGWSGTAAFAVGDAGSVLAFNGQSWSAQDAGTSRNLASVWAVSGNEAWAFAEEGSLFRGVDGVWTQDPFTPTRPVTYESAVGLADGGILAVGTGSLLRRVGSVWTQSDFVSPTAPLRGVWHDSHLTWIVGPASVVYLQDGSFEASGTPRTLTSVWSRGENVWAVGEGGAIVQRGGGRWAEAPGGVAREVRGLWLASDGLWAVGESNLVMRRVEGLWRALAPPPDAPADNSFRAIWGVGDALLLLGDGGKVYVNKSGQWSTEVAATGNLNALWGAGDVVWAVGEGGLIRRRRADGVWVSETGGPAGGSLNAIWGTSATDIWAVGSGGAIYHRGSSCTASVCWSQSSFGSSSTATFSGVWGTGPNNVWVVGGGGVIYRYNGTLWASQATPVDTPNLNAIAGRDATHVWAVGDTGTILLWDGNRWSRQAFGSNRNLRAVWVTQDTVWAGGLHGTILKQ